MKREMYLAPLMVAMLIANGFASSNFVQITGLRIETLSEAQLITRKWGTTAAGFRLSVASSKEVYHLGDPIAVSVLLRNVSNQPLQFVQTDAESDYEIEIVGSGGKTAPLTSYGQSVHSPDRPVLHSFAVTLKPGESIEHILPLEKLYDVSQVGTYSVAVTRRVPKEKVPQGNSPPQFAEIRSNTIRITIQRVNGK